MNLFKKTIMAAAISFFASQASAITFSNLSGIFDDTDDLLAISGTIDNVGTVPFTGIWVDYDPSPTNLFTSIINGGSLVFSSIGGSLNTFGAGISAIIVDGITSGGNTSGPLDFSFIFSLPGGTAGFAGYVDMGVFVSGSYGDQEQNVFLVTLGDVQVAAPVPLPASLPLLLVALGGVVALRKRRDS